MKTIHITLLAALVFSCLQMVYAGPPEPQIGMRWVLNEAYSDEFNGATLDKTKWRDTFDGWKGRSPAKFDPTTVSLQNGNMQIKNKKLAQPDGDYTIGGGAVQSLGETASFGYYECRFKASRISMSTTFWMSNGKVDVNGITKKSGGIDCPKDRFSQELDICESVGGTGNFSSKFRTQQNFNTHYRYIDCNGSPEKFYSAGNNAVEGNGQVADASIDGESWQDFHTYACYWKNANVVDFYTDNRFAGTVNISTDVVDSPFPRPMRINMVTETYNWAQPYPTDAQLNDNNINTSYYDWIRSYKLVPVDQDLGTAAAPFVAIYQENVAFSNFNSAQTSSKNYSFELNYQANSNRDLHIILKDKNGTVVSDSKFVAYAGYGKKLYTVSLPTALANGNYTVQVELRPVNGDASSIVYTATKALTIGGGVSVPVSIDFENPSTTLFTSTSFTFNVNYTVDAARDVVLVLTSPTGTWLGAKTQTVQAGTSSIPLTIALTTAPPAGTNYKVSAIVRNVGGDWTTNMATKDVLVNLITEAPCTSQFVQNGCFENGGFEYWSQWGAGTRSVITGANVSEGNFSLKLEGIGAAEQVVNGLQPNTTYVLTVDAKIEGTQFVTLGVKTFGGLQEEYKRITNTSFEEQTIEFTTGATATSAVVYFYSPAESGIGYADNFSLQKTLVTGGLVGDKELFSVYPNPTENTVHLSQQVNWELYTPTGQLIAIGNNQDLYLEEETAGVYYLKANGSIFRIVKQ